MVRSRRCSSCPTSRWPPRVSPGCVDASPGDVEAALANLAEEYRESDRGFQLREVAGGWRFYTHPAYHDVIESYVLSWDTRRLSQAALEALAVVAYHQPVTRAGINAVRGVNSEGVLASLVEKGLVREVGRDKNQATRSSTARRARSSRSSG